MNSLLLVATTAVAVGDWEDWLVNFGTDQFLYPSWATAQKDACKCTGLICTTTYQPAEGELSYCAAKNWTLQHMPTKDTIYLPGSVSVQGDSMLDDSIIFSMMADKASGYSSSMSLPLRMAYILPHSSTMEAISNWRPLLFSKYFGAVAKANITTTWDAIEALAASHFTNWTAHQPPGIPARTDDYHVIWHSSTSPPVASPFDFLAYGYGSCTAWATLFVDILRSLGIPARVTGSPCWNGGDFQGLVVDNKNVTHCWTGGVQPDGPFGGHYLNNHNWVEYWDTEDKQWNFMNVPVGTSVTKNTGWMCKGYTKEEGCCGGGACGVAMQDHEIFSYTWTMPGEIPEEQVVLGSELKLSNGQPASPLVWAPNLKSPTGEPISHQLRVVNRTSSYRCKQQK
eukprot:TRINITY_DN1731_c0_g1_i2.p1 TRINITY_DN1731_c0_g1~~TRINITY_DN1731_c0_g1_i2.p1  ORF type:complete len:420 (+),score=94.45 TRINITY_DN1731_c0_g1_i2:71-1261(+)